MNNTLEQKLAEKENEVSEIRKQIKARDAANKPKSITDKINGYNDILTILGADESKDNISIDLFTEAETKVVKAIIKKMRICKVYNQGVLPKRGGQRWYSWYNVSSGFVFHYSYYDDTHAFTGSASRLSFLNEKLLKDATKKFQDVDEAIIDMQD